jgi:mannose-6-phosphate isomerase-like protein (cupin superfamily)
MKKSIQMILSVITLTIVMSAQSLNAQEVKTPWPGVTKKVLLDNEHVNVAKVTFAPGAAADWHSHPQYTVYAITDVKLKVEVKDKKTVIMDLKAGQAGWSPAVTHKTTNVGKKPLTVIVTEMK